MIDVLLVAPPPMAFDVMACIFIENDNGMAGIKADCFQCCPYPGPRVDTLFEASLYNYDGAGVSISVTASGFEFSQLSKKARDSFHSSIVGQPEHRSR
jgi:hypothetical protein